MAHLILERQFTPIVGEGKSRWNNVHVGDLADCFALLVNKAVARDSNPEIWGAKGYMFTENGEHLWADLARTISAEAVKQKLISNPKEDSLSKDEALKAAGFEAVSWGLNSRGKAERARETLGWEPTRHSIEDEVPTIVKQEHARMTKS